MLKKPDDCAGCPLEKAGLGFIKPEGLGRMGVALVGEAGGKNEAKDGLPFRYYAESGSLLERCFKLLKRERKDFWLTNVVSCRPPGDALHGTGFEAGAVEHCKRYLEPQLAGWQPRCTVALGNVALKALVGVEGIIKHAGYAWNTRYGYVVAGLHPAFIRRGKSQLLPTLVYAIQKALRIAHGKFTEFDGHPSYVKPSYVVHPSIDDAVSFRNRVRDNENLVLAYDIENPESADAEEDEREGLEHHELVQIQFSLGKREGIAFPWQEPYIGLAKEILSSENMKLGHNVWLYDNPVLRELHSIVPRGMVHDTLAMFHHMHPDLEAGLQKAVSLFDFPFPWKHLAGSDLEWYGCADADACHWLWEGLVPAMQSRGVWDGYLKQVARFYPILVNMQNRGVGVNAEYRDEFKGVLELKRGEVDTDLQKAVPVELLNAHPKLGYKQVPREVQAVVARWEHWKGVFEAEGKQMLTTVDEYVRKAVGMEEREFMVKESELGREEKERYGNNERCVDLAVGGVGSGSDVSSDGEDEKEITDELANGVGDVSGSSDRHDTGKSGLGDLDRSDSTVDEEDGVEDIGEIAHVEYIGSEKQGDEKRGRGTGEGEAASRVVEPTYKVTRWCRIKPFAARSSEQVIRYIKWAARHDAKGVRRTKHVVPLTLKEKKETTSKEELERLYFNTGDPVYKLVVEFREYAKILSTDLPMWEHTGRDERIHTTFTMAPASGQLSSRAPNIQNVIKHTQQGGFRFKREIELGKAFRKMIVPGEGRILMEFDKSAFHVVMLGREAQSLAYVRAAKADMHSLFASHLLARGGKPVKPIDPNIKDFDELKEQCSWIKKHYKEFRDTKAKPTILGVGLGLGANKLWHTNRENIESPSEARNMLAILRELFKEVFVFQDRVRMEAHQRGILVSLWQFCRTFYDVYHKVRDGGSGKWVMKPGTDSEKAIAFYVQNHAFGMMREEMMRLERIHANERFYLINTVHDSLVFDVARKDQEYCYQIVTKVMNAPCKVLADPVVCPEGLVVAVDCAVGENWGSMKGWKP